MAPGKSSRAALGLALTLCFLIFLIRGVNIRSVLHSLAGASLAWIVIAFITFSTGYACRIERWRLMLVRDNPNLTWSSCAGPFLASFAANNVLPLRAGDVLRAFSFNEQLGVERGSIIATMYVERLLDLLMVLFLLGVSLSFFKVRSFQYAGMSSIVLMILALGILLALLFSHLLAPALSRLSAIMAHRWPRYGTKFVSEITTGLAVLKHLAGRRTMISLIVWSTLAWSLEACVYYFSALAISTLVRPSAGFLALPLTAFATLVPSAPGYIGTFDFVAVRSMVGLGNDEPSAAAYAVVIHAIIWLPITLAGGLSWILHPGSARAFKVNRLGSTDVN